MRQRLLNRKHKRTNKSSISYIMPAGIKSKGTFFFASANIDIYFDCIFVFHPYSVGTNGYQKIGY